MENGKIKIALVHDFLTKLGGAEKVLMVLSEMFPEAPIYTLLYDEKGTKKVFAKKGLKIIPSYLQKYPAFIRKRSKFLLSSFPKAIEEFNFSEYDIVISSSNSYAHAIITNPKTFHLSYCYSPMRYVWDWYHEYLEENKIGLGIKGLFVRSLLHKIRIWDKISVSRANQWVAISETVKSRIKKYYKVDAKVIFSPVEISKIKVASSPPDDYYIIVSRIEPYKKIELAVEAFNKSGKSLVIIGVGSQEEYLKSIAKSNIEFLGWQSDESVYEYMREAKAFVFPGEEDYGLTPIESMACGRPVVAFRKGGVTETVVEGKTGLFFDNEAPESLNDAIDRLEKEYDKFTIKNCREQSEQFSKEKFITKFNDFLDKSYREYIKHL